MGRRAWSLRLRRGLWPSLGGPLRRAWVATDPNGTLRALEEIRRLMVPASAPARPSAGAEARFTGPLSVRSWRGDARLGDDDLADWLIRELGGDPGTEGVPVELVVRVLADDEGRDLERARMHEEGS